MKRCNSVEEVKAVVEKMQLEAVENGYMDADDAGAFIVGFNKEYDRFVEKYNVEQMDVFTTDEEMEDELFGIAIIDGQETEVFMSARCDDVRLMVF